MLNLCCKPLRSFRSVLLYSLLIIFLAPELYSGDSDILRVRGDSDYPPFEYLNEDGEPEGFNIDVFQAVAEVMKLEYEISLDIWQVVRTEIETGEADVLLGMYKSEERDRLSDFSIPHFISSYAVFVRRGSEISGLSDAEGLRVGVQQGDIGYDYILSEGLTEHIIAKPTIKEALEDLEDGLIDCAFISRLQGLMIIREHNLRSITAVGAPAIQRNYCFAVTEGDSRLLAVLNEGLSIIKTSGEYDKIYEKWFGVYAPVNYRRVFSVVAVIVSPFILIALLILIWNRSLKRQVSLRTSELRRSREYYRITLNSIGDAVIATDLGGRVTGMNPVAEKLTGWDSNDAAGRMLEEVFNIIDAENRKMLENPAAEVLRSGRAAELKKNALLLNRNGNEYPVADSAAPIKNDDGEISGVIFVFRDISEEYRIRQALEKRLMALTRPEISPEDIDFKVLFNIDDIQQLQDDFSSAFKISSVILDPQGNEITRPSNHASICMNHIRNTKKGFEACMESDRAIAFECRDGKVARLCSSAGFWDGGVSLRFGNIHLGSWIAGQARMPGQTAEQFREFAREIGCDEDAAAEEFLELPEYSEEEFGRIINALETLSKQLTDKAYQNIQFARLIREKSESEKELRSLQAYLSDVIDSMPSILIGIDSDKKITRWNQTAEERSGISAGECTGRDLFSVLPWLGDISVEIDECLKTSENRNLRRKARTEGENRIYENITVFPLIKGGDGGAVIIIENVTAGIRLEELMIQSEKMVSVGGLAAGMAHEINNPLAGMIQTSSVISSRLLGGEGISANSRAAREAGIDMESMKHYMELRGIPRMLDSIMEAGGRAAAIVANMLTFARKADVPDETHSIDKIVDKAVELAGTDYDLKRNYDFRKIRIEKDYEDGLPGIYCESAQLQQVFLNILKNGAQAMHSAGTASPVLKIRIKSWPERAGVSVEISDSGPGMNEEIRKRVFEPFFTTKPVGTGTGLGMSVSYFIVADRHKGEMYAESAPGSGAVFTVKLPGDRDVR